MLVTPAAPNVPGEVLQPNMALPAIFAAADPDPLKASLDSVWAAINTYGERYPELLEEIWSVDSLMTPNP
ncbi:hypothetical protein [Kribbella sp. DT2]|uniref:hypothetical protein n=1 Tax=Kribbella sp. DT2 TaxID=3393427 RepID=UPI003CE9CA6E